MKLTVGIKFHLKLTIFIFLDHHDWILHIRISLSIKFHLRLTVLIFWTKFSQKRVFPVKSEESEQHYWILHIPIRLGANISRCYGTSRPIKRELTIYGTARPRGKFSNENSMALLGQVRERELTVYGTSRLRGVNKNAMVLLGQSRDSWPSMAPLGHVELTKMKKLLESKSKTENSFLFSFLFLFLS